MKLTPWAVSCEVLMPSKWDRVIGLVVNFMEAVNNPANWIDANEELLALQHREKTSHDALVAIPG